MRVSIMSAVFASFVAAGCASTSFEPITFHSTPPGALIGLDCGVDIPSDLKTPATVRVRTNAHPCVVTLTMEGYETKTIRLLHHVGPQPIEAFLEDTSLGTMDYKSEIIRRTLWMLFHSRDRLEDGRVWTHTPRAIDVELKPIESADA